jgi:hypothetical protein
MAINPFAQPINYSAQFVDLTPAFRAAGEGFRAIGEGIQEREKQEQAMTLKAQYATDLQNALNNPTQETWSQMIAKYPQQREAFAEARKGFGETALANEFNQGFEVSTALENKRPEVAKERLQTFITARKNSNLPTGIYEDALEALERDDVLGAQANVNSALAMADPDRFQKQVEARLKASTAPSALKKSVADADAAVADAEKKVAEAADTPTRLKAEQELRVAQVAKEKALGQSAQVTADFARENALADLKKKAADLGLTNAQTNSALATTRKLNTEIARAALELEALKASGGVDPDKKFTQEEKIRKEWQGRSKVYGELGGIYSNLKSSADAKTGPGDIALITGFMKMLDPGSVVRETEFATARDTAGLFERLTNQATKIQSGQLFSLDSKQRGEYVALAKQYLDAAEKKAAQEKKDLGIVVKNYKLNPENVFGVEDVGGGAGRGSVNPPTPQQRNVTVNY